MALLLILFILVLGFRYSDAVAAEKIALRRSNGWEAYVRLGWHGLVFLANGMMIYLFLLFAGFLFIFLGGIMIKFWGGVSVFPTALSFLTAEFRGVSIHEPIILFLSWGYCESLIRKKQQENLTSKLMALQQQDAILHLVIEAARRQSPIKVSLKSRKVYIGIILAEQFEHPDADNITLIPYHSGHRDKETLQLALDSNYISVYEKYGIFDEKTEEVSMERLSRLEDFRLVIRLNEVESLSLFEPDYYFQDFNP